MLYNLKKLTKEEIETIIRSLPPKFVGLYCYATSHYNNNFKNFTKRDRNKIELYDADCENKFDLWGEYDKALNYVMVVAQDSDPYCRPVEVYLFDNCFEIPAYRNGVGQFEKECNQKLYRKQLEDIFALKAQSDIDNYDDSNMGKK